jgi:hypothetical protein
MQDKGSLGMCSRDVRTERIKKTVQKCIRDLATCYYDVLSHKKDVFLSRRKGSRIFSWVRLIDLASFDCWIYSPRY